MLDISVIQGSSSDWVLAAINRDGTTPTGFLVTDTLTSSVWRGQDQQLLFSPAVSWNDFTTGLVNVSVDGSQTATLEQLGDYHLNVTATRDPKSVVIIDCTLRVLPAPGSSTQATTTYCSYQDMLRYANWITLVQDGSADQEGFYSQRLEARQWLDWLIVRSWRGTSQAYFGDAGRTAAFWLGGWVRRTPLPSKWLKDQLDANLLLIRPQTQRICALKAASIVGMGQIGRMHNIAQLGALFRDMASSEVSSYVAEIDLNNDGIADLPIPIGSTNTLFT